ncbi:MAG: nitrophenyl compound nitroreductase subunit ArsF family protein [Prevotellaceae bacterium]|jgi:arsenate reductase-like glutaredoxin family protein|nr:nitrophenyl compound nitroreductase subunit ArsF family protein [Prevotellaceae bacterium]
MKKVTLAIMFVALLAACGQSPKKAGSNETSKVEAIADASVVKVYYFHGKARCKTCVAVGDVAKETVEKEYASNEKVVFIEINTSEKEFEALCEKYEISWNALIIAKGEDFAEITEQAFATAVGNPQALENLIKEEVNKRLQ